MQFDAALINKWGVTFAIVLVKQSAMAGDSVAAKTQASYQQFFAKIPIVLASQDSRGLFRFWGRRDLVSNLAKMDPASIRWGRYRF